MMTLDEARNRVKELDSGSGFYSSDYEAGWEDALRRATEILDKVEPVGKDKLTIAELACEFLRMSDEEKADFLTSLLRGQTFIDGWNHDHGINGATVKGGEIWLSEI